MDTVDSQSATGQDKDEKELQERRVELLTSIRQLHETGGVDSEIIHAKRFGHNGIVDSINALQAKHRSDPINKYPPELFTQIIYQAIFDRVSFKPIEYWELTKANGNLLSLTLVSQRWMQFIINTPIYWTFIVLDETEGDWLSTASVFLQFSRELPITVYIRDLLILEQSMLWSELLQHRNRISGILYNSQSLYQDTISVDFQKFMEKLSPLPSLKMLQCRNEKIDDSLLQSVLDMYPTLSEIHRLSVSERSLRCLMLRNCKSISLHQDPEPVMRVLEDNLSLREVNIDTSYRSTLSTTELPLLQGDSTSNQPLNWSTLRFDRNLSLSFSQVITRRMPHLVHLSVGGSIESLIELATSLHSFPRLQELFLRLQLDSLLKFEGEFPTSFLANENIRVFSWSTVSSHGSAVTVEWLGVHKQFTTLLSRSLPGIRYLYLQFGLLSRVSHLNKVFNLKEFGHLPSLQRFDLVTRLAVDADELPSCGRLSLYNLRNKIFPRLSSQTVQNLFIYPLQPCHPQKNYGLSDQAWPSIEILSIPINIIANSYTGFPHLRKISLQSQSIPDSLTKFCRNLALYPNFCPALEELSIDECPEWDIFFIMLERRLMWSINGSRALKVVALPAHTPRSLQGFVCEIVQGKLPDRPSNFELSLFGNAELLLDMEIPGCHMCIRTGARCLVLSSLESTGCERSDDRISCAADLPEYPQNEDEILRSWEQRLAAWKKRADLAQFRQKDCRQGYRGAAIRIDQFSSPDAVF
ncbi:hypothetical protein CPB86DRAFT_778368 [Serendipita vermifera]|nr:hypothetical protein CPB86DRAFT_778368 [Serendipita vermifera]